MDHLRNGRSVLTRDLRNYFIHEIERYFFNKKTRIPILFGVIQLGFALPMLGGLMFAYSIFAFTLAGQPYQGDGDTIEYIIGLMANMELHWIFFILCVLEGISVITKGW